MLSFSFKLKPNSSMQFLPFEQWITKLSHRKRRIHAPILTFLFLCSGAFQSTLADATPTTLRRASSLVFSGTTVGAPSLVMPDLGSTSATCTTNNSNPNTTKYRGITFTPGVTGAYTITVDEAISTIPMTDDTLIYVYQTTFNSTAVCTNFVVMGNDPPGTNTAVTLTSGTQYILIVAAAFETEDAFQVTIANDANNAAAFTSSTPLPVELTSLSASISENGVSLNWVTASESSNDGWDVEAQVLGNNNEKQWRKMGFVQGAGTITTSRRYQFDLGKLIAGQHTFRLKQYDFDGTIGFSEPIQVLVEFDKPYSLVSAYPNPFNPTTQFALSVLQDQKVTIQVYNVLGQKVATLHNGQLKSNVPLNVSFNGDGLASGLYVVQMVGANFKTQMNLHLLK